MAAHLREQWITRLSRTLNSLPQTGQILLISVRCDSACLIQAREQNFRALPLGWNNFPQVGQILSGKVRVAVW